MAVLQAGTRVDRYVVEHLLGSGGMAEVYAVRHAVLGSVAALKVLRVHSPQAAERTVREGRAQATLVHPNVVTVLDLFEVDGAPALLMERVAGPTLAELLIDGPLPVDRALRLSRGILAGLNAAHAMNVVHRDLKPSNVLVAAGDVARITDFGLASAAHNGSASHLTLPGVAMGTPAYMAPEQHEDAHLAGPTADLFAFGIVVYEMLAGTIPAGGESAVIAWQRKRNRQYPTLQARVPNLPPHLTAAVTWALSPDPADRPPDVGALWVQLFDEPFPERAAVAEPRAVTIAFPPSIEALAERRSGPGVPKPARPCIGRQKLILEAFTPLDAGGGLVTLVGTAGVGKTRLAIEVATQWQDAQRPLFWVELASSRDEQDIVRAVGVALNAGEASAVRTGKALDHRGALLLVLDNVEHLVDAAKGLIAGWLRAAPSLRILTTSREPLGLTEEHLIDVAPFALPVDAQAIQDDPGWAILVAASPPGALAQTPSEVAMALLRRLDGLPLALELAGARIDVLTPADLSGRLEDPLRILSDPTRKGSSDAQRHAGLHQAIAWSWSLLSPSEQRLLAQLSAFAGEFTIEAAETVAVLPDSTVLDTLQLLVRKRLVRRMGQRFSMLSTIRAFAEHQLMAEAEGWRTTWRRHAAYHGEQVRSAQRRGSTFFVHDDLLLLMDDFAAVLERAKEDSALHADVESAALGRVQILERTGPMEAVISTVDRALALLSDGNDDVRYRLLVRRSLALRRTGHRAEALAELHALADAVTNPGLAAVVFAHLGDALNEVPNEDAAVAAHERAYALAVVHGPAHIACTVAAAIGVHRALQGNQEESETWFDRSLEALPVGDLSAEAEYHKHRAFLHGQLDQNAAAREAYLKVHDIALRLGDQRGVRFANGQLGMFHEVFGELEQAHQRYTVAAQGFAEAGDPVYAAYYRAFDARVSLRTGAVLEGVAVLDEALRVEGMDKGLHQTLRCSQQLGRAFAGFPLQDSSDLVQLLAGAARQMREGDRTAAQQAVEAARPHVHTYGDLCTHHVAEALLSRCLEAATAWRIAADGSNVEMPDGVMIDLSRYPANARVLARLAARRIQEPGSCADVEELAAAGWPKQRILPAAAGNRVRVALSFLRRAGLSEILERADKGWRLTAEAPVQLV